MPRLQPDNSISQTKALPENAALPSYYLLSPLKKVFQWRRRYYIACFSLADPFSGQPSIKKEKMRKRELVGALGLTLFILGVLAGVFFIGLTVWADLEATLFNLQPRQYAFFRELHCPPVLISGETGTIRARFKNPLDQTINLFIRAHVSHGYVTLRREIITELTLAPGEVKQLQWTISEDDAAFNRIILFRIMVRGGHPLPNRQATCGVMLLHMPYLTGWQMTTILLGGSILAILAGDVLWFVSRRPYRRFSRVMILLTLSVFGGLLAGARRWWVVGAMFLVIILLTVGAVMGHFLNNPGSGKKGISIG